MLVKPYSPDRLWNADEYLAWESQQEYKNELIDNRVWIMCGANARHNQISVNLMLALHPLVEEQGYELLGSRMCLEVDRNSTFVYPDMTIVRGEPNMSCRFNQHTFDNPTHIIEIYSPSTESIDRNRKRELYLQIPSVSAYYLVAQDKPLIEAHQRTGDEWLCESFAGLEADLVIPALDCEIPLSEIYRRVSFAQA